MLNLTICFIINIVRVVLITMKTFFDSLNESVIYLKSVSV